MYVTRHSNWKRLLRKVLELGVKVKITLHDIFYYMYVHIRTHFLVINFMLLLVACFIRKRFNFKINLPENTRPVYRLRGDNLSKSRLYYNTKRGSNIN